MEVSALYSMYGSACKQLYRGLSSFMTVFTCCRNGRGCRSCFVVSVHIYITWRNDYIYTYRLEEQAAPRTLREGQAAAACAPRGL